MLFLAEGLPTIEPLLSFPLGFLMLVASNLGAFDHLYSKGLNWSRIVLRASVRLTLLSLLEPFCAFCFFCFFDSCGLTIPCSRREAFSLFSCDGGMALCSCGVARTFRSPGNFLNFYHLSGSFPLSGRTKGGVPRQNLSPCGLLVRLTTLANYLSKIHDYK